MKVVYTLGVILLLSACMPPSQPAIADARAVAQRPPTPPSEPASTAKPPTIALATEPVEAVPGSLADRPEVQAFIRDMAAKHGFDKTGLTALFSRAQAQPDIIATITRPAEAKPWHAYRDIFLTADRIQGGVDFWRAHRDTLARAERVHGVPPEIVVAILGVETKYGRITGKHRVLEALATLAFDYPRRADFFRKELENYLLLAREEGIDPLSLQGSYAGAMGLAQFMPSSYRAYAVDFDGDRHRDLWHNPQDAIGSIANYLSTHRWKRGELIAMPAQVRGDRYRAVLSDNLKPQQSIQQLRRHDVIPQGNVDGEKSAILLQLEGDRGPEYWLGFDNFYVITRYNRSPLYAMAVYQLGQEIRNQYGG